MITRLKHCCAPIAQRWVFALMGFLGLVVAYGMRVSLSIAITEMVSPVERPDSADSTCPRRNGSAPKNSTGTGTYDWSEHTQGIILSSFYWGYVTTQLPGALIAKKLGAKHTLGLGILTTALLTLLLPKSVEWAGASGLIGLRVLMGVCEGVTLPALSVMLAQWVPAEERSKAGSLVFVGAPLGSVFASCASGLILKSNSWPTVFYFFGGVALVWWALWSLLCYDTPRSHPFVSDREAKYLDEQLSEHTHEQPAPVPWRHLLTSMPLWALIGAQVGHDWAFYTLATDLPKYMSSVLHFEIDENGYLSALPYLGMWLCCLGASWLADWLVVKGHASITLVRKLGTTIASVGPATFVVAASYASCDRMLVVGLFTLGVTLLGFAIPSLKVNALDLSPNYAGTVTAMGNGAAACTGILTPYIVGLLTPDQTLDQWRTVFWIIFGMLVVTNAFYLMFASGRVADWNDPVLMERRLREERLLGAEAEVDDD